MRYGKLALAFFTLGIQPILSPSAAHAQHVYNTLASFDVATTLLTDVNFNSIVPSGSFTDYSVPPGYTSAQGVNFTFANPSGAEDINVTSRNFYSPAATYSNDFLIPAANVTSAPTWQITLPTPATAVGLDLGTFYGGSLQFSFSNGDTYTETTTAAYGSTSFIGFTFTSPITSLDFVSTSGDKFNVVDDLKFGTAVPELSSMLAFGSFVALGTLIFLRQRKQARNAA